MTKSKYVPKRRFKEFELDSEWELLTLSDISEGFEYGLNVPAKEFDGVNKYLRITDIDDTSREFLISNLSSPDANCESLGNYLLAEGDVLFARTGASTGKTYYYKETDGKVFFAGFLIRARVKGNFDHRFVFQNTLTKKYKNYIELTSQRSGQPGVNAQEYSRFSLNIPSLSEQKVIGDFVEKLDSLISLHQHKLDKLKNLKKAYLSEMFPAEGERVPKHRFPGFEGEWEYNKLMELAEFSKGKGYSKSDLQVEGQPIILYGRLYTKYETVISQVDTFTDIKENSVLSKGGEVLVPSSGESADDIARASVVDKAGIIIGGDLNIIKLYEKVEPVFLALAISNGKQKEEISKRAQGKSVVHVNNDDLKQVSILSPSLSEQKQIGNFFKKLDQSISLQQQKLDKLNDLKKAYLNELFV